MKLKRLDPESSVQFFQEILSDYSDNDGACDSDSEFEIPTNNDSENSSKEEFIEDIEALNSMSLILIHLL